MGVQAAMTMCGSASIVNKINGVCGGGAGRRTMTMGCHQRSGGVSGGAVSARASYGARPPIVRLSRCAFPTSARSSSSRSSSSINTLLVRCDANGDGANAGDDGRSSTGGGMSSKEMFESSSSSSSSSVVVAGPTEEPFKFPDTDFLTGGGDDGPIGNQAEAIVKGNSAAVLERSLNPDGGAADLDYLQELIAIQSGGPKAIGRVVCTVCTLGGAFLRVGVKKNQKISKGLLSRLTRLRLYSLSLSLSLVLSALSALSLFKLPAQIISTVHTSATSDTSLPPFILITRCCCVLRVRDARVMRTCMCVCVCVCV